MFLSMAATSVCVPRMSHSCPPPLQDSPRPAGRSDPGSYQITAFALGPSACWILCVPFKSEVSISPSPVELLQLNSAVLQSQMLWGLILLVPEPWPGELNVGLRTITSVGAPLQYNSTVCESSTQALCDLIISRACASYLSHCGSFFMSLVIEYLFW